MQQNINSPLTRNSYGFSMPQSYIVRSPQNKGLNPIVPPTIQNHHNHQQYINASIKNLQNRIEMFESPNRKKPNGQSSPTIFSPQNESRFKPQFMNNSDLRVEESNQQILRGSCSNLFKKFQPKNDPQPINSTNLGVSLRNTTHFNPINKFSATQVQTKKPGEESNPFKNSNASKISTSDSIAPSFMKQNERPKGVNQQKSKTPTKFVGDKSIRLIDQGSKPVMNKTPLKYKPAPQSIKLNKNSGISKASTETNQQKKTFKSLNQIVQTKAKEKIAIQKNQTLKKYSKVINSFQVGPILGKGKFGQVFLCRNKNIGFIAALKKIVKSKVAQFKMVDQFCTQIRLHSALDHPNIVRFYGCFEDKQDFYLVIEYMNGGTLFDYLNQVNSLPLRETVEYLRDIIQAVTYMHERSIAHRDIKPQNIVLSSQGVAKLCDFGWSALVETNRKTYCGTFDYAPPEILQRKTYDASVDIWCIGVLTYQLLTGRVPFEGQQRNIVMQKIVNVDKKKIEYPSNVPIEARQFIEALVQKDPNLRPKSQDLLKFKLFSLFPRVGNKTVVSSSSKKHL